MRTAYHDELHQLNDELLTLLDLAEAAMTRATLALLQADPTAADDVIARDSAITAGRTDVDHRVLGLIATQQPVAAELRTLVASLRISSDLERMGHLARHVAEVARSRYPAAAVPQHLRSTVLAMSAVARSMAEEVRAALRSPSHDAASRLAEHDDQLDQLQAALYRRLLDERQGTTTAMDIALVGRYYERYGDHAVSVAEQVAFLTDDAAARR